MQTEVETIRWADLHNLDAGEGRRPLEKINAKKKRTDPELYWMLLLFALPGHNRRRPEAFCRESKTFRKVAAFQGVADEQFGQAQARLQVLIVLRVAAFAEILFAVIRELENTFEEISLSLAAIVGEVLAHD